MSTSATASSASSPRPSRRRLPAGGAGLALGARDLDEPPDPDPPALAWAVAQAASPLLARCRIPIGPGDPNVPYCLQALDRLPRTTRIDLLTVAIRYTAPDAHTALPPETHVPAPGRKTAARDRTTGPCPCPRNSGGFCGGCGHAGCRGRR